MGKTQENRACRKTNPETLAGVEIFENRRALALIRLKGVRWFEFGFCFFWAVFQFFAHYGPVDGISDNHYASFIVYERLALALIAIVITFWAMKKSKAIAMKHGPTIAGFTLAISSLCQALALADAANVEFLLFVSAVLLGFSGGLFLFLWQAFYGSLDPLKAGVLIPASIVLSILFVYALAFLPVSALFVAYCIVFPIAASYTLNKSLHRITSTTSYDTSKSVLKDIGKEMWRPVMCLAVFALLWQISTWVPDQRATGGVTILYSIDNIGLVVALAVLVIIALFFKSRLDVLKIYSAMLPVATGLFIFLPFVGGMYGSLLTCILYFGFEIVSLSLKWLGASRSFEKHWNPQVVYGFIMIPEFVAMAMGNMFGRELATAKYANNVLIIAGLSLASIYLLTMVYYLVTRKSAGKKNEKALGEIDCPDIRITYLDGFVAWASKEYRLTPREKDVLHLTVRGYSFPSISAQLGISLNTTKEHAKNIYVKLNVHSKQELIDMAYAYSC